MDKKLWRCQLLEYKGQIYGLTRLGFGLSLTSKIMTAVLKTVLTKDDVVKRATSSYINDVLVEEVEVTVEKVRDHVNTYGLTAKPVRVIGKQNGSGIELQQIKEGKLMFRRGNDIPEVTDSLRKRKPFSVGGKLVGHYPTVGWLQTVLLIGGMVRTNGRIKLTKRCCIWSKKLLWKWERRTL